MNLPETAVPIEGSVEHWIDVDGSVYCIDRRNKHTKLIRKQQRKNQGYMYCGVRYPHGTVTKRVHKLVALAFIPNPQNLPIVGHRNNRKDDNRVENLYWTTHSENTKKAFDDGLAYNTKGIEDSQSMPVIMYDANTNAVIGRYGSIKEAARETDINASTIGRQAKYKRPNRKPFYFRYADDLDCEEHLSLAVCDYETDAVIDVFGFIPAASQKYGVPNRTICQQLAQGKPKRKFRDFYFKTL